MFINNSYFQIRIRIFGVGRDCYRPIRRGEKVPPLSGWNRVCHQDQQEADTEQQSRREDGDERGVRARRHDEAQARCQIL